MVSAKETGPFALPPTAPGATCPLAAGLEGGGCALCAHTLHAHAQLTWEQQLMAWMVAGQLGPPAPTLSLDRPQGHSASASSHFVFPPAHSRLVLARKPLGDLVKVTSFEGAELDYSLGLN